MKRLISYALLVIGMLCLSSCLETAFVAGTAAGGAVVYDNRDMDTMVDDQNIAYQARLKIKADTEIAKTCHIDISSFDRIVLLVGQAPTPALKERITQLVQSIPKIRRFYNEIEVEAPLSTLTSSSDAWITTKVKTNMLLAKGLHMSQIKVVTENGIVYLMGLTTHNEADIAIEAARRVAGVQKVVKVFEYVQ